MIYLLKLLYRLEFCNPNQTKPEKSKLNAFQVHVDYISYYKNHIQERVTEEILERDCSAFGEIVDVVIKNHTEVSSKPASLTL